MLLPYLNKELQEAGCDVRVMLPGFPAICAGLDGAVPVGSFAMPWGERVEVVYGTLPALAREGRTLGAYVLSPPGL